MPKDVRRTVLLSRVGMTHDVVNWLWSDPALLAARVLVINDARMHVASTLGCLVVYIVNRPGGVGCSAGAHMSRYGPAAPGTARGRCAAKQMTNADQMARSDTPKQGAVARRVGNSSVSSLS